MRLRMKRHFALYLAIVWCLSGLLSGASQAQGGAIPPQEAGWADGAAASTTWLLRLRDGMPPERARQVLSGAGLMPIREIPRIHVWVVEPQGASMQRAIAELREHGEILWAEPNGLCYAAAVHPDDPYYWANQWNLRLIGLPDAWMFSRGDSHPIAVVDTGIDFYHPDLADKIWRNPGEIPANGIDDDANGYVDDFSGWNFAYGTPSPQDDNGHGTHVAGIAGAATDNGVGVAGISWLSPIMPLKALWYDGTGSWADIAEAIIYAADNGAHIINLSLGASTYSNALYEAVRYAYGRGCFLVAAAGNYCYSSEMLYPAAFAEVFSVAATTANDERADFSCQDRRLDVAAPGVNIYSTYPTSRIYPPYTGMNGTSMASPHVAGLAALLWAANPSATAAQIARVITSTAKDIYPWGRDAKTGWGRIDAAAAFLATIEPRVALSAPQSSIRVQTEAVRITAFVTQGSGQPVPDGLTVTFTSNIGTLDPPSAETEGGEASTLFSSQTFGQAVITASLSSYASDTITIYVKPKCKLFFPHLFGP